MKHQIYIETYGCSANQNNSEIMAGLLTQAGHIITNNQNLADIIILNTCVVKGRTENKIKRRIQDLDKQKEIIISGCMSETDAKELKKLNPNLILLKPNNFKQIANLIRDKKAKEEKHELKLNLPKIPKNKLISIHQISEGCLGKCSYCKTRLAKGKLFSYPDKEILKSIESDLKQGAKEIWITSQDNAAYGLDRSKGKHELPELLKKILSLKHRFKLRLGMMDPNNIIPIVDELIELYKDPKMYKFIHAPIQSASNEVLKNMNRLYKIRDAGKIIKKFKKEFPNITIATDIITAYPTENSEDHKKNLKFIEKYKPDVFNLSKFSKHKGTPAENLKEHNIKTIRKRTKQLMQTHKKTALANKDKFLGKQTRVFVNQSLSNQLYRARDKNYNIVIIKGPKSILGKEVNARIKETGVHYLIGEYIK
jgi:threonylcarbamoyladenosine tRNA methylthiotransferase CDKAL1